jgi:hypothetical protein
MKFFIATFFSFIIATHGQAAQKAPAANAMMARATASFINKIGTVDQYLMVMSKQISPEQMENFKKQLTQNGISGKTKFPKMNYDGNKVFFDKKNYIIYVDANTVNVNGHLLKKGIKGIDVVFKDVMENLKTKKSASFGFIQEAHALSTMSGLVGMVGAGALGYFVGPMLGLSPGMGAAIGAGAFFLGNELYQSWRDGQVSCDGEYYVYRGKSRNSIFASSTKTPLDGDTLGNIFGGNVPPCSSASAKMVENGVKSFGTQPQPLGYPPYQQPMPGSNQQPTYQQQQQYVPPVAQ